MPGTVEGGRKASITNKAKYGEGFYQEIGRRGGAASGTGGFGQGEEGRKRASMYGRLGGLKSRRKKKD